MTTRDSSVKVFGCTLCHKSFKSFARLVRHYQTHQFKLEQFVHLISNSKIIDEPTIIYKCDQCDMYWHNSNSYYQHKKSYGHTRCHRVNISPRKTRITPKTIPPYMSRKNKISQPFPISSRPISTSRPISITPLEALMHSLDSTSTSPSTKPLDSTYDDDLIFPDIEESTSNQKKNSIVAKPTRVPRYEDIPTTPIMSRNLIDFSKFPLYPDF